MLNELFGRITRKRREWHQAIIGDLRGAVIAVAKSEMGEPIKIDEEHCASIIEAAGISEQDFRACVELFKSRVRQSKLAAERDARREKAEQAEADWIRFKQAESARRVAADQKLLEMERAVDLAITAAGAATEALAELLFSSDASPRERELSAELLRLRTTAGEHKIALNPAAPTPTGGGTYMVRDNPAAMARVARAGLAEIRSGHRDYSHKAAAEESLRVAEAAVAERRTALAKVEKQMAAVDTELRQLAEAKLLPESFALIKSRPTRDERRKQYAREIGVDADQHAEVTVTP